MSYCKKVISKLISLEGSAVEPCLDLYKSAIHSSTYFYTDIYNVLYVFVP